MLKYRGGDCSCVISHFATCADFTIVTPGKGGEEQGDKELGGPKIIEINVPNPAHNHQCPVF